MGRDDEPLTEMTKRSKPKRFGFGLPARDEARRLAANFAKLPELVLAGAETRGRYDVRSQAAHRGPGTSFGTTQ
ncbi:MAG: hypothetical protein ABSA62_14650 [Methyloceanibacter sp.]